MIFTPVLARRIAVGRKTEHRVPELPRRAKVGHDYAVIPGRHRIQITSRRRVVLGDITFAEARAEGHRTTDAFAIDWVRRHDRDWLQREKVDLVACYDDDVSIVDWILCERFAERHADRAVWCLCFELVADAPRFMARQPDILAGGSQYTANRARALDPDAEATPAHWLEREARRRAEVDARMRVQRVAEAVAERQRRRNLRAA